MLEALAYEPLCWLPCHRHSMPNLTLAMRHREAPCGMSWLLDSSKCHGIKRAIIHLRETCPNHHSLSNFGRTYYLITVLVIYVHS